MTEVTQLAAAALAIREALERIDGAAVPETGLFIRVSAESETDVRTVGRIVADVEKRYGISIKLEFGR